MPCGVCVASQTKNIRFALRHIAIGLYLRGIWIVNVVPCLPRVLAYKLDRHSDINLTMIRVCGERQLQRFFGVGDERISTVLVKFAKSQRASPITKTDFA